MSLSTHVGNFIRSMYMHMRHISRIRHHLDDTTLVKVVMVLVISALYGVTDYLLKKLQLAQNNAARLVRKSKKYDHITPIPKDLHWLPVKSRIIFKVLSIVHSAMHSVACPSYIQELVTHYAPPRALRSVTAFIWTIYSPVPCSWWQCFQRLWPLAMERSPSFTQGNPGTNNFWKKTQNSPFQSSFRIMNFFQHLYDINFIIVSA